MTYCRTARRTAGTYHQTCSKRRPPGGPGGRQGGTSAAGPGQGALTRPLLPDQYHAGRPVGQDMKRGPGEGPLRAAYYRQQRQRRCQPARCCRGWLLGTFTASCVVGVVKDRSFTPEANVTMSASSSSSS